MRRLNEVAEAALDLSERERALLAERLLESLDTSESTDEKFVRTILARSEALDRGESTAIDGKEAVARMRSQLEREIPKVDRGG